MSRAWALLGLIACADPMTAPPSGDAAPPDGGRSADAATAIDARTDAFIAPDDATQPTILGEAERAALMELVLTSTTPPEDRSNQWADDPAAAELGRAFFFDPGFSGPLLDGDNDGTPVTLGTRGQPGRVSCAGCHIPTSGFSDTRSQDRQISLASGWGLRRTPSLLNVGHAKLLMWDGRHDALYNQVFGPIESSVEMNSSRLFAAHRIAARYRAPYEAIFGPLPPLEDTARFPMLADTETGCTGPPQARTCRGMPGSPEYDGMSASDRAAVTRVVVNMGKALAAYQRLLTCGPGRFDAFMLGDAEALSEPEQRGAALFVGRGRCAECHRGPFLSDEAFHNVGLAAQPVPVSNPIFTDAGDRGAALGIPGAQSDPLNVRGEFSDGDDGRLDLVVNDALEGAFRTPMLRCVAGRPSFMHTAQLRTLEDVVAFFSRGGHAGGYVGTNELVALDLTPDEQADLVAFLRTLDGPGPPAELLAP